jgi:hypothetical protein
MKRQRVHPCQGAGAGSILPFDGFVPPALRARWWAPPWMSGIGGGLIFARLSPRVRLASFNAPGRPSWHGADTVSTHLKEIAVLLAGLGACAPWGRAAEAPAERAAFLTQEPFVMRLSKDEFRIAFGINAPLCVTNGCSGVIRYRVDWKTEDGTVVSELRRVSYELPAHYSRTITVDRQYLDTAEGAHTTEVVRVTVDAITCLDGAQAQSAQLTSTADIF